MNTVVTAAPADHIQLHTSTPSFFGMLRGEFFKISRLRVVWIMLVLLAGVILLPYLVVYTAPHIKDVLTQTPLDFLHSRLSQSIAVLRVFLGVFLIILTAYAIGQEYQLGTIRVLLSRGVGRLQLLSAKLTAIVGYAILLLIGGALLNILYSGALMLAIVGNLNAINAINATFWSDSWTLLLTVMVSMGVTILMATAASVVGRSLTIGLSAALAWFAVDNFGTIFLYLAYRLTHNDFWLNVTAYLLGPNLNVMPKVFIPSIGIALGANPYVNVDATHILLVVLAFALVFAAVAIVLTWLRDVKE